MSSVVLSGVILNYISATDIAASSGDYGASRYTIMFDSTVATDANPIMFEYKINVSGSVTPVTSGFVAVENATQTGVENQYIVAVPATGQALTNTSDKYIQMRVYAGVKATNQVVTTEWSPSILYYEPPATPVIEHAYYDPAGEALDNLYVFLNVADNPAFNYSQIQFVVCYYFINDAGDTVWNISNPAYGDLVTIGTNQYRRITVSEIGQVSTVTGQQVVYTSVHAVYNWTPLDLNKYYALSYVSNTFDAPSGSTDDKPDITSVVYNVYVAEGDEPGVPGDQTMLVSWSAPGNSGIPFYAIQNYTVKYSLDGGSTYLDYATTASDLILEYLVDVGATGLDLTCGDDIMYVVSANLVNTELGTEDSDPYGPVNIFKYSEAPTNLVITDTFISNVLGINYVNMTVNFDGVNDSITPNKGCGTGLSYLITINGTEYTPASGSLTYVSGSSYSIVYTDIPATVTGEVVVRLQTQNTNASPAYLMDGQTVATPYFVNNLVLQPVVYNVYGTGVQTMDLSWALTFPLGDWSVSSYTPQVRIAGVWSDIVASTSNTVVTYNVPAETSATTFDFRVIAHMTNGSVSYNILSNIVSENYFSYPSQPAGAIVNWAVSNDNYTTMDVNMSFNNPVDLGVNNGLQYFIVEVFDSNNDPLIPSASQNIPYVSGGSSYLVEFNNITYSASGNVIVTPYVTDTNNGNTTIVSINVATAPYITASVPLFQNVSRVGTTISGQIVTSALLKPVGTVAYPVEGDPSNLTYSEYSTLTNAPTPGWTLSKSQDPDTGVWTYLFSVDVSVYLYPTNQHAIIFASNDAGIGGTSTDSP